KPSREMVLTLAQALEVPLRERNELLKAAGFAALYRETPLDAPALAPINDALQLILRSTDPNPPFIVNRRYDVLDANAAGRWILTHFVAEPATFVAPVNMARLIASPRGMRPFLDNWEEVARKVFGRLTRDLGGAHQRDAADDRVLEAIADAYAALKNPPAVGETLPFLVGVRLKRDALALDLFTTIATLGTPLDVTLQELRIETLYAADAASRTVLANRG